MKDFRRELTDGSRALSPQQYSVEQVADELAQFLNDEMKRNAQPGSPQIGIIGACSVMAQVDVTLRITRRV